MDTGLTERVALITGAAGGIGRAIAQRLLAEGAYVALLDRDADALRDAQEELAADASRVLIFGCDVTTLEDVEDVVGEVVAKWQGLDCLVNVAGGGTPQTIRAMSPVDWERIVSLNLTGPFNTIKASTPALARSGGGSIVTVGSLAGLSMSFNNGASYTAAKAGVLGLTRHAAFELGRQGIRVNAVLPGPTLTPQMERKISAEMLEAIPERLALGRWVKPDEVANAILFFCSDLSSACTGTHVIVDSGQHIGSSTSVADYFGRRE